jgi:hypothetical protein
MTMCAGNKEKHPGVVGCNGMTPRRLHELVRKRKKQKKDKEECTKKLSIVASLEDKYALEDDEECEAWRIAD